MKKIYTVTLDDDVPLSDSTYSDIREIAYLLFEEISKFDRQILCIDEDKLVNKDGIIKNELYEFYSNGKYTYRFTSDNSAIDYRMYEPFIVSDKSFGFTVNDGSITDIEIQIILDEILKFLKSNYKFTIDGNTYYNEDKMSSRLIAIDVIANKTIEKEDIKRKKLIKTRINPLFTVLGLAGR